MNGQMFSVKKDFLFVILAVFVFFVSFSLRVKVINETMVDSPIRNDAKGYYFYAMNLKKRGVYSRDNYSVENPKPDSVCSPGYPMAILPFVEFPPTVKMVWDIQRMQVVLGLATVALVYLIAQYCLSRWLALVAAFLAGISPHLVVCTTYVLTEILFTFLMFLSLWFIVYGINRQKNWILFFAGLTLGLASLTRPTLQYFILALIPLVYIASDRRFKLKNCLLVLFCFLLTMAPWFVRNYHATGKISDSRLKVSTLAHGIYPDFMYKNNPESKGFPYRFDPGIHIISKDMDSVLAEIKRRFQSEPYRHLTWYFIKKPVTLLSWNILGGKGDIFIYPVIQSPYLQGGWVRWTYQFMKPIHWLFVTLSLLGTVLVWVPHSKRGLSATNVNVSRLLSLLMLYFIAIHIIGAPFPRYGIPLRPVMYIQALFVIQLFGMVILEKWESRYGMIGVQGDE
ncbi:ArnT family glycosyltransferase [Desulfoluna limicola]|uniref:ArnT family glycosyltransferase n=1 Tax=Desulfoluna limicola TaxID=2810562 RepID=UPI001F448579|nr:glycosyltransferase family 39 protein [Desulfoluna limicola]